MANVVVYHFEMTSARQEMGRSKRAATRETIEALGFTPIMETAEVVDRSRIDGSGFVRPEHRAEP